MQRFVRWRAFLIVSALASAILLSGTPSLDAGKGNGKGGGEDDPPLPDLQYKINFLSDHPDAPTGFGSSARGMNSFGDVVGEFYKTGELSMPFLWTSGNQLFDLHGLVDSGILWDPNDPLDEEGWVLTSANDINDSGQIAGRGYYVQMGGDVLSVRGYRLNPPENLNDPWSLVDLGNLGAENGTVVAAINNSGDVVGSSNTTDDNRWHAFLWTDEAGMTDLGVFNGSGTQAKDVSNRDTEGVIQIVGAGSGRAWRYQTGTGYQDLGTLKKDDSGWAEAYGVNDLGNVVGLADAERKKGNDNQFAFLYDEVDGMISLGTLSSGREWNDSWAHDVNNLGEVVGVSLTVFPDRAPFYSSPTSGIVELDALITNLPVAAQNRLVPIAINNHSEIGGTFEIESWSENNSAFILTDRHGFWGGVYL